MQFDVCTSPNAGDAKNCSYPNHLVVDSLDALKKAIQFDHVCAVYKSDYRSGSNFLSSDCLVMDCDNDHSDDPGDWITAENLAQEYEDIAYAITYSRHHEMVKDGRSARPRFHVYFQIPKMTDPDAYAALKKQVQAAYTFYDDNALDAARFIFGSPVAVEPVWHEGSKTIVDLLHENDAATDQSIPEGKRNSSMSRFASKVIKRFGYTEHAHDLFLEKAARCDPPLPDDELQHIWKSAKKFADKIAKDPNYVPPEKYHSRPPFIVTNMKTMEDMVSAPRLAKYVRENVRYILVRNSGKQGVLKYVYRNGVYELFAADMMQGLIKSFIEDYNEMLVTMSKVSEAYSLIMTDLNYTNQDCLNDNENIINFQNGLLYLDADRMELLPHTTDVLSTIQIPCDWTGKDEPTPVFDAYMKILSNGDSEIRELLLEFMGACISNVKGYRMKKSLFLYGNGDTGKSQLKRLTELLIGKENFIGIDLKEIEARFGTGTIYGTRLAGSSDMSFLSIDELKTFKKLTGGDSVFAEFKGQQAFEYTYSGMLWFCMNKLPKFGGDTGIWVFNRIMPVLCPNVIPENKQDKFLLEKMYAEREGIVYKAVTALRNVIKNNFKFTEPDSVKDMRARYMGENSTIISFYTECMCSKSPSEKVNLHCTTGIVYKVYAAWCKENNYGYAKSAREFREGIADLLKRSYPDLITHIHGCSYFKDMTLNDEAKHQYADAYGYDDTDFME